MKIITRKSPVESLVNSRRVELHQQLFLVWKKPVPPRPS